MLAYDARGRAELPASGEVWSAPALASGGLLAHDRPHSIVIQTLQHWDERLGFIMLDGSRREGHIYRVLAEQISNALKGVMLLQANVRLYQAALAAQQVAQEKPRLVEEADRLKSRFLSMVSHELRTLILVEGLSEMMLREEGPCPGLGGRPTDRGLQFAPERLVVDLPGQRALALGQWVDDVKHGDGSGWALAGPAPGFRPQ